jgi:dTDP-4-dehydrorhamnose reductase
MTVALFGSRSQLGRQLRPTIADTVVAFDRPAVDLAKPETIRTALRTSQPDCVINCAAYNHVDRAEAEADQALAVNALGVRELARCCAELDCPLVQFSTDYVFGLQAARVTPYTEGDAPGPVNVYGTTKLAGEYLVRAICPRHLIIRTCGLYGENSRSGKGTNFVTAILRQAASGSRVAVVNDQRCTPTSAADLARATLALIAARHHGVVHLTNAGDCSWFEFAEAIVEGSGLRAEVNGISSAEYPAAARRPRYSVLDCTTYDRLGLPPRRPWREALRDFLATHSS